MSQFLYSLIGLISEKKREVSNITSSTLEYEEKRSSVYNSDLSRPMLLKDIAKNDSSGLRIKTDHVLESSKVDYNHSSN